MASLEACRSLAAVHGASFHEPLSMNLRSMNMVRMMFLALALGAWVGPARAGQSTRPAAKTELAGQIELARLVDLSAERLGYKVEYDAAAIKGTVTLRLGEGL